MWEARKTLTLMSRSRILVEIGDLARMYTLNGKKKIFYRFWFFFGLHHFGHVWKFHTWAVPKKHEQKMKLRFFSSPLSWQGELTPFSPEQHKRGEKTAKRTRRELVRKKSLFRGRGQKEKIFNFLLPSRNLFKRVAKHKSTLISRQFCRKFSSARFFSPFFSRARTGNYPGAQGLRCENPSLVHVGREKVKLGLKVGHNKTAQVGAEK